jgi:diketogulonate reductase-like aldo/keto reductase
LTHYDEPQHVRELCENSLRALRLQYLDLYLMHWPFGLDSSSDTSLVPKDADGTLRFSFKTPLYKTYGSLIIGAAVQ